MTNELIRYDIDQLEAFCKKLVDSDTPMLPEQYRAGTLVYDAYGKKVPMTVEQAAGRTLAAVTFGAEIGLTPWQAIHGLYVPASGRVGILYATIAALLRRAGYGIEWPQDLQQDEKSVTVRLTDQAGRTHDETFDIARASRSKATIYVGGSKKRVTLPEKWTHGGADHHTMLRARAITSACRVFAADVFVFPVYSVEEVRDMEEEIKPAEYAVQAGESAASALARRLRPPEEPVDPAPADDPEASQEAQEPADGPPSTSDPFAAIESARDTRDLERIGKQVKEDKDMYSEDDLKKIREAWQSKWAQFEEENPT